MSKGQTQLIFVFILAALIIGIILLVGYKGIYKITETSEDGSINIFISNFKEDVNSLIRLKRSSKLLKYKVPHSIYEVCFVETDFNFNKVDNDYPMLTPYQGQNKNLFLLGKGKVLIKAETLGKTKVSWIDSDDTENIDFKCVKVKGRLEVRLEGGGDHIIVESKYN